MGCPWNEFTCAEAAKGGHLACLQYAHENGCPWKDSDEGAEGSKHDAWICSSAALALTLDCLQCVVEQGAHLTTDVMWTAVDGCQMDKIRYLLAQGCPCDARATHSAAVQNSFDMLILLHENGCPWDSAVIVSAAKLGYLETVKYAHEHGCPWPEPYLFLNYLSPNGCAYMMEQGCPGADQANTTPIRRHWVP